MSVVLDVDLSNIILITGYKSLEEIVLKKPNLALNLALLEYLPLEYNIQVLTIETTVRKPWCIRVQITAVTSAFYFMPVLCVLYSKTLKR